MAGPDAVRTVWESSRHAMRILKIRFREQCAEWIHSQGFPMPRWRGYISARVQERSLSMAVAHDAWGVSIGVRFCVGDIGRM